MNVALDVFIGLILVFLLYSLLATILMEFIAHAMHLRPRLLMKALRRMLEDNPKEVFGRKRRLTLIDFFSDTKESIKRYFAPFEDLYLLRRFYYHPSIKYLGESRSSSKPSYMHADNFSQTVMQMLRGKPQHINISEIAAIEDYLFREAVQVLTVYEDPEKQPWILFAGKLQELLKKEQLSFPALVKKLQGMEKDPLRYQTKKEELKKLLAEINGLGTIDAVNAHYDQLVPLIEWVEKKLIRRDTLTHLQNLFLDANNNLDNFKDKLERWFEETMERTTGWYKRQTQLILLCLGLGLAIWGNVDTIKIYRTLAKDKKARDQMVALASQVPERYGEGVEQIRRRQAQRNSPQAQTVADTLADGTPNLRTTGDTILDQTYKLLQQDLNSANTVLGLGWCINDSCKAYQQREARRDSLKNELELRKDDPALAKDTAAINVLQSNIDVLSDSVAKGFSRYKEKWKPLTGRGLLSLLGWIITALAVSLGAPFWFDMLNKIVRLRSAGTKLEPNDKGEGNNSNTSTKTSQPSTVVINQNAGEEAVG